MDTKAGGDAEKRIERAGAIVARVAQNVATVVEGKDEQIRLVARRARLPGARPARGRARHGEDGARPVARRLDRGRDACRGSSARRISSRPTSPGSRSGTRARRDVRVPAGARSSPTCSSSTRSTARCRRRSRRCSRAMAEHQVTVDGVTHAAARPVLRHRDREHDRAGGNVPAARGAARPVPDPDLARLPDRSTRSSTIVDAQLHGHPLDRLGRSSALDELADVFARASRRSTSTRSSSAGRSSSSARTRDARHRRGRRVGARQPRARAHGARVGARRRARATSSPRTSSACSRPSSATG